MQSSGHIPPGAVHAADLEKLFQAEGPFATVYLTTEGAIEKAAQHNELRWRSQREQLDAAGAPARVLEAIDQVVPDAHHYGNCLGAIATAQSGVLHVEHGPWAPGRDTASWASLPSLGRILSWRQALPTAVVVLADRRGADIFAMRYNEPDIRREAGGNEDPIRKVDPGGWSQPRYQQRVENTWERNAKEVADEIERLCAQVDARLIVAAGDVRAMQLLKDSLNRELSPRLFEIQGTRHADGSEDETTVHVEASIAEAVARDTELAMEKFMEERGEHDRAVVWWRFATQLFGGASLICARALSESRSIARSPIDTMPTGLLPSVMTIRRNAFSRITSTARDCESSGVRVTRSSVAMSPSVVLDGFRPSATARTVMSRSVTMPCRLPLSSVMITSPIP